MIIGSLAGPLCAGGGFCAGSDEIVEHQRISAAAYTFSAALPAMLATTASEALSMIQTNPDIIAQVRENIKTMWAQLDPRSDWVRCTSSIENPIVVLVLKPEVVATKKLRKTDQELLLQEVVDEVSFLDMNLVGAGYQGLIYTKGVGQWSPYHSTSQHAKRNQRDTKGYWMGAAARSQSLHHFWSYKERDREGRNYH